MKRRVKAFLSLIMSAALLLGGAAGIPVDFTEMIGIAEAASESRFSDTEALSFLNGKRAVHLYGNTIYLNVGGGYKRSLVKPVIFENETGLIDEEDFEKFFGVTVDVSGSSVTVTETSGNAAQMELNSYKLKANSREYSLSAAPVIKNNVLYLPAKEYGEAVKTDSFIDDGHGLLVLGTSAAEASALKAANLYMYFERKSADGLKEQFLSKTDSGAKHPRLIADEEDFTRLRAEVKSDSLKSEWYSKVIATADSILTEQELVYTIKDGRLLDVANSALSRLEYLGFAYQMTKDSRYAEKGIQALEAICAFPDWHPEHYLDTGTLASAAAIGYDWLYGAMTDSQRQNLAVKAQELALDTAKKGYYGEAAYDDFWCDTETNWGIVCNGGIANLALATAEYNTDNTMEILRNALRSIEIPWYRIAPDGAWYEGTDYWSYLFTHMSLFMSSYKSVMGEAFGESYMGMDKYAYFQAYFQGPDGKPNNFHDADSTVVDNAGQFYMAGVYNDASLMLYRIDRMKRYNIAPCVFGILWCDAGIDTSQAAINLDKDKYFRETEFAAMRGDWNSVDSAWLSFHGGYSNNAHDHVDAGTFVYNIGGVRWAIDLGKEPLSYLDDSENPALLAGYDSKYFYRRKGEGHNIVVINPDSGLEQNINAFAQVYKPVSGTDGAYSKIDLSSAYSDDVNSYIRGYRLSDNRRTLTVRDEIELKAASELHWFMHTEGEIEILDNNTAVIRQNGKALLMRFVTDAENSELTSAAAECMPTSPQFRNTENSGVTKIDYKLSGRGSVNITVQMSLIGDKAANGNVYNVPIAQWTADLAADVSYPLINAEQFTGYEYKAETVQALSGKPEGDTAYSAVLKSIPCSVAGEGGFEIPFYKDVANTSHSVRTLELSLKYNEGCDYAAVTSDIYAHASVKLWFKTIDFVKLENGRVYIYNQTKAAYVDTGLTAKPDEWYRIVISAPYNAADTRIYINGKEFDPQVKDYNFYFSKTDVKFGMSGGADRTGLRDVSVTVDDVEMYEGAYVPSGADSIEYTISGVGLSPDYGSRVLTVKGEQTAETVCKAVTSNGTVSIIASTDNSAVVYGNVSTGNIVLIVSGNGRSYEYITINSVPFDMDFSDEADMLALINRSEFTEGYTASRVVGASGAEGDAAYKAELINAPYSAEGVIGFDIPYYTGKINSAASPETRTLELSVKYNDGCDYAAISSYVAANPSAWSWNAQYDFVSFKEGKVYVGVNHSVADSAGIDTGIAAEPDKWYRIVIEEHYNAADTRVFINGHEFESKLPNYIYGNRWTQVRGGMLADSERTDCRTVSVTVDDIKIYTGDYMPSHEYTAPVTKLRGTGSEANDIAFYGQINCKYANEVFGFKLTLPSADGSETGTMNVEYSGGSIEGEVVFGLIIRNLNSQQIEAAEAGYIQ